MQFNWPILGHTKQLSYLQRSIANNQVIDAYLFIGPPKIGKALTARYFINSILCAGESKPCQKCFHCQAFARNVHPDVFYVSLNENKKQISIEQIRELISHLNKSAVAGSGKIALIGSANFLNPEASNALLKTLEEPRRQTKIILLSDQDTLLPTIKSRCQSIKFFPLSKREIINFLLQTPAGKKNLTEQEVELIANLVSGQIGLACELAQENNLKDFNNKLTDQLRIGQALVAEKFRAAEKISSDSERIKELLWIWQYILKEIIGKKARGYSTDNNNLLDFYVKKPWSEIIKIAQILEEMPKKIKQNVNTKLILENFFLNL